MNRDRDSFRSSVAFIAGALWGLAIAWAIRIVAGDL